jgi:hypothetical protein
VHTDWGPYVQVYHRDRAVAAELGKGGSALVSTQTEKKKKNRLGTHLARGRPRITNIFNQLFVTGITEGRALPTQAVHHTVCGAPECGSRGNLIRKKATLGFIHVSPCWARGFVLFWLALRYGVTTVVLVWLAASCFLAVSPSCGRRKFGIKSSCFALGMVQTESESSRSPYSHT